MDKGNRQNAQHLREVHVKNKNLFKFEREQVRIPAYGSILKMIRGDAVSREVVKRFLANMKWNKNDCYRIYVLMPEDRNVPKSTIFLLRDYLSKFLPLVPSYILDDYIVLLLNESNLFNKKCVDGMIENIRSTFPHLRILCGVSLGFKGFNRLNRYVGQAIYAIKRGQKEGSSAPYFTFYEHALDYIMESTENEDKFCACHPDVIRLWHKDTKDGTQLLETLTEFIRNERSYLKTSESMFIHRNTVVYRIRKIMEQISIEVDDAYTREYIITSVRLLKLFGCKLQEETKLDEVDSI
jgi:hypothetical protein